MEQNIKLITAFLHIKEAASLLESYNNELYSTLTQLGEWIKTEFNLKESEISEVENIAKEIDNG